MSWPDYISTILAQNVDESLNLVGNLSWGLLAQDLLEINASIKANIFAEIFFETIGIHAFGANLYRLQHIDTRIYDHRQQRPNSATTVQQKFFIMLVGYLNNLA
jgi:hypothetical protein